MKNILFLLLAACASDPTTTPDATISPDAYVAPECVMPPVYDGPPCQATVPGAACGKTFSLPGTVRGCCVTDYVSGETHYFQCKP